MKEIKLTQGKVTLVDDTDYEWLNQWKWYADKRRNIFYAKTNFYQNKKRKVLSMHRLILNASDKVEIDHIDLNGLNNQRLNLRQCTHAENLRNQPNRKNKTSKYKGVSLSKHFNKWRSCINVNHKRTSIGYFDSEIAAATAYDKKAKELFGEFARLNLPDIKHDGFIPLPL